MPSFGEQTMFPDAEVVEESVQFAESSPAPDYQDLISNVYV